jgi:hypothetical protein
LIGVLLVGCAHQHRAHECCSWREDQLADYRKAALEAAASPEQWQRVGKRLTSGSLKLDTSGLAYVFYSGNSRMDILIPTNQSVEDERTGARIGTKLRVTLDAVTALTVSMKEEVDINKLKERAVVTALTVSMKEEVD